MELRMEGFQAASLVVQVLRYCTPTFQRVYYILKTYITLSTKETLERMRGQITSSLLQVKFLVDAW